MDGKGAIVVNVFTVCSYSIQRGMTLQTRDVRPSNYHRVQSFLYICYLLKTILFNTSLESRRCEVVLRVNCSIREVFVVTSSLNKLGVRLSFPEIVRSDRYVLSHVIFLFMLETLSIVQIIKVHKQSNYDVCKTSQRTIILFKSYSYIYFKINITVSIKKLQA